MKERAERWELRRKKRTEFRNGDGTRWCTIGDCRKEEVDRWPKAPSPGARYPQSNFKPPMSGLCLSAAIHWACTMCLAVLPTSGHPHSNLEVYSGGNCSAEKLSFFCAPGITEHHMVGTQEPDSRAQWYSDAPNSHPDHWAGWFIGVVFP